MKQKHPRGIVDEDEFTPDLWRRALAAARRENAAQGGKARALKLSPERRREIAIKARAAQTVKSQKVAVRRG